MSGRKHHQYFGNIPRIQWLRHWRYNDNRMEYEWKITGILVNTLRCHQTYQWVIHQLNGGLVRWRNRRTKRQLSSTPRFMGTSVYHIHTPLNLHFSH